MSGHAGTGHALGGKLDSLSGVCRLLEARESRVLSLRAPRRRLAGGERGSRLRTNITTALVNADGATLDDLREAVTTLEDAGRTARRVFGGAHPFTARMEQNLPRARAALRARETRSPGRQA